MSDLFQTSERLWQSWKAGQLEDDYIGSNFCTQSMPEPYLFFENGRPSVTVDDAGMVFLTTNPGGSWSEVQGADAIRNGTSLAGVTFDDTYLVTAKKLGAFYVENLKKASLRRIQAMSELAAQRPFMQVECIPFHSADFPEKRKFITDVIGEVTFGSQGWNINFNASKDRCPWLNAYAQDVRASLGSKRVCIIQAVGTGTTLPGKDSDSPRLAKWLASLPNASWLTFVCELAGIPENAVAYEILSKNGKTTCCCFSGSVNGVQKSLVLMKGSNNFPGPKGLAKLMPLV